jgi:hypothetical protein
MTAAPGGVQTTWCLQERQSLRNSTQQQHCCAVLQHQRLPQLAGRCLTSLLAVAVLPARLQCSCAQQGLLRTADSSAMQAQCDVNSKLVVCVY